MSISAWSLICFVAEVIRWWFCTLGTSSALHNCTLKGESGVFQQSVLLLVLLHTRQSLDQTRLLVMVLNSQVLALSW